MEYVADELGVGVLKLPALQRPLSIRADTSAILALREIIRERRPDVLHTHTAKAGATGRLAALAAGSARPRAVVHTYHGHVLSGYFSRRWEWVFRRIERRARACDRDARGGQRRGARRSRRLRRRAARSASRSSRTGSTCPSGARPTTRRARRVRSELGLDRRHARDRLGRAADRDQTAPRPRADAARGARRRRRRRARARRRRRGPAGRRGAGARPRRRRALPASSASSSASASGTRPPTSRS